MSKKPAPNDPPPEPFHPSPAQGISAEEWARMSEAERWAAIGERPYEPDTYEPGGPGWMDD